MLRKIRTQDEVAKRRKRNQFVIGGVLILLMVVATAGYSLMSMDSDYSNSNAINEFGYDFYKNNGYWSMSIDGSVFGFSNLPSEVENISTEGVYDFVDYVGKPLYFVGNGGNAEYEILINMNQYVLKYQDACIDNETCEDDLPLKTCNSNLIIFEEGDMTSVKKDNGCVYLIGDYVKAADAFLYKSLKIY